MSLHHKWFCVSIAYMTLGLKCSRHGGSLNVLSLDLIMEYYVVFSVLSDTFLVIMRMRSYERYGVPYYFNRLLTITEIIKAPHFLSFLWGIFGWPIDSPHKRRVILKLLHAIPYSKTIGSTSIRHRSDPLASRICKYTDVATVGWQGVALNFR